MRILFIAPYLQKDGWGYASQAFIKSLEDKCDLCVRNIYLGQESSYINHEIFPHLIKKYPKYDAVIQKLLPNMVAYDARCGINCAISCLETQNNTAAYSLGLMDKIFTFTEYEKIHNKWPHDNVFSVGEPLDTSIFDKDYGVFKELGNNYKFYFIGENISRKRLAVLIKAYLSEFSYKDNVNLVVKSDTKKNVEELVKKTKLSLRKYFVESMYPPVSHIGGNIEYEQICKIHQTCDCFVMPSCGEAFCRPLAEAVGFGNNIIINKNTSMSELVDEDNAWLINSNKVAVSCEDPPIQDIYTCYEKWSEINEGELRRAMRESYNGKIKNKNRKKLTEKFSFDTVGNNIIKCLES